MVSRYKEIFTGRSSSYQHELSGYQKTGSDSSLQAHAASSAAPSILYKGQASDLFLVEADLLMGQFCTPDGPDH
jgi:hypothetical protein